MFCLRGTCVIVLLLLFQNIVYAKETLTLHSEVEGVNISINEVWRGTTSSVNPQTYVIEEEIGTGGFGFHKLVAHKELNATHELYGEKEFKYTPFEPIFLTTNRLQPRLKKTLLAHNNGLVKTIPLRHRFSSHISVDKDFIYVLSQSRTKVYSKQKREESDAEYLEIYDKHTLLLHDEILLNNTAEDSYDRAILVHQGFLYIASKNGVVIFWDIAKGFKDAPKHLVSSNAYQELNRLRAFGEYLFKFGKDGVVEIYQHNLHVKTIDVKQHRFQGYANLEDKRFDRIFDVLYANEKLFIANDLGEVHIYGMTSNPLSLRYETILKKHPKETYDVLSLASLGDENFVAGTDRHGLYLHNAQRIKAPIQNVKVLSKNDKTTVYRMQSIKDYLFFTEGLETSHLYMYDMKHQKLVHDFEGTSTQINDFHSTDGFLFSVDDGNLHVWNTTRVKNIIE